MGNEPALHIQKNLLFILTFQFIDRFSIYQPQTEKGGHNDSNEIMIVS